jgi:hypothetical protein
MPGVGDAFGLNATVSPGDTLGRRGVGVLV